MIYRELYAFEFIKNGTLQKIIHNIKYKGNKKAAFVLGIELGKMLLKHQNQIDVIIPVPVSDKKRFKRGFNQSEYIAKGVQNILGKPILNDFLKRKNNLRTQTKSKRYERWQNVESQYFTTDKTFAFENILLVDDVITSGATIHSCLRAFQSKNFKFIVAALAARKGLL
jgi:ComF family protein